MVERPKNLGHVQGSVLMMYSIYKLGKKREKLENESHEMLLGSMEAPGVGEGFLELV